MPLAGTQAYQMLEEQLTAAEKTMTEYTNMSIADRTRFLTNQKVTNLQSQKLLQDQIAAELEAQHNLSQYGSYEAAQAAGLGEQWLEYQAALKESKALADEITTTKQEGVEAAMQANIMALNSAINTYKIPSSIN